MQRRILALKCKRADRRPLGRPGEEINGAEGDVVWRKEPGRRAAYRSSCSAFLLTIRCGTTWRHSLRAARARGSRECERALPPARRGWWAPMAERGLRGLAERLQRKLSFVRSTQGCGYSQSRCTTNTDQGPGTEDPDRVGRSVGSRRVGWTLRTPGQLTVNSKNGQNSSKSI